MSDINISSITGLPELPEGQYWHVERSGDFELPTMRVEVRKRVRRKTRLVEGGRTQYPTVLEALRANSYRVRNTRTIYLNFSEDAFTPDLWSDDIELVDKKTEAIEHFTPKRFLRKPKLDWTEYEYSATVLWDGFAVLLGGHTADFTEDGILEAAIAALDENRAKREIDSFVAKVSGSYPPKKLEAN